MNNDCLFRDPITFIHGNISQYKLSILDHPAARNSADAAQNGLPCGLVRYYFKMMCTHELNGLTGKCVSLPSLCCGCQGIIQRMLIIVVLQSPCEENYNMRYCEIRFNINITSIRRTFSV